MYQIFFDMRKLVEPFSAELHSQVIDMSNLLGSCVLLRDEINIKLSKENGQEE